MLSRKNTRDSAYKLIYEYLFQKKINEKSFAMYTAVDISEEDKVYLQKIYYGVVDKYDELLAVIAQYANNFPLERIFKLDLAALLLAIYEMKYMEDIPLSVSINEAVELVKTYSTEKSNQFVNGILSSVFKEIRSEEKI